MVNITDADWKLFRARIPAWQERYMEQLTKGYIELLSSQQPASSRFWELEKRIREDKKHPGVLIEMRRSNVIQSIISLVGAGVITIEDLEDFSEELINVVKSVCGDMCNRINIINNEEK